MSSPAGHAARPRPLNVLLPGYLYGINKTLEIVSHQPPQPFGERGNIPPFDENPHTLSQDDLKSRSINDHVFTKLPIERQENSQLPPVPKDDAILVVTKILSIGDGTGAQVVVCKFGKKDSRVRKPTAYWNTMGFDRRPTEVVAKIYDPLLYPKTSMLIPSHRRDVINAADRAYAREAAAYAELHEAAKTQPILRDFVPRFYGTWTTTIENKKKSWGCSDTRPDKDNTNGIQRERPVRIILMEYVEGQTIWKSCQRQYEGVFPVLVPYKKKHSEEYRLNIFARILRGFMALQHVGIIQLEPSASQFIIPDAPGPEDSDSDDEYPDDENPDIDDQSPPNRSQLPNKRIQIRDKRLQPLGEDRVVMVGYSSALVTRYLTDGPHEDQSLPRPRHPSQSKNDPDHMCFLAGWFPRQWLDNDQPFVDWVRAVFRDEDFAMVKPLPNIAQPGSPKEVDPSLESTKQSSGPDKVPPKTPKIRLLLKNSLSHKRLKTNSRKAEEVGMGDEVSASCSSAGPGKGGEQDEACSTEDKGSPGSKSRQANGSLM